MEPKPILERGFVAAAAAGVAAGVAVTVTLVGDVSGSDAEGLGAARSDSKLFR
jgi:hypothetical protein